MSSERKCDQSQLETASRKGKEELTILESGAEWEGEE